MQAAQLRMRRLGAVLFYSAPNSPGVLNDVLSVATGALMSHFMQGESIPGIAHLVHLVPQLPQEGGRVMELVMTLVKAFVVGGLFLRRGPNFNRQNQADPGADSR